MVEPITFRQRSTYIDMRNLFGLNRSLGSAIGVIGLVALVSSGLVLLALNNLQVAADRRARSNQVISELDAFRTAMLNQETGLRGYLLTGNQASLEPYQTGAAALDRSVERLRSLLADNTKTRQLRAAEDAARGWQTSVAARAIADAAEPSTRARAIELESSGEGRRRFDLFRSQLNFIQTDEERLLDVQRVEVETAERWSRVALWVGAALTLAICIGVAVAINRLISRPLLKLANAMRRLARRDLTIDIPSVEQKNEVGEMARAVQVFQTGMIELDRTSLLRVTADTLPALVGYVDSSRHVGFLNEEFGRWFDLRANDVSEVYGRRLEEVFALDPFPGVGRELESALSGTAEKFEHRLARRGEAERDVEATFRPHRAPDGTVLGVVTLLTDITERKEWDRRLAQQASDLQRSNEELEQFAYVASHDLKAPLRGIENLVSWIEEDLESSLTGDTRTNMDLLKSRVRRLESLLDDLLAYSRAGRVAEGAEDVDTRELVEELAVLVDPPEGFSISADPQLPVIHAARAPLTQVFQNLIGNAIKHHDHPSDGHIWIEARPGAGAVLFVAKDDGPGIPPRFHDRVFGMFQTLKPRDEVEGSGMGLAIVKKIVERQGGKIWLDARDGRGLAVHFTWPTRNLGGMDGRYGQSAARR